MSHPIDNMGNKLDGDNQGLLVRSVYYAVIVGLGLMLFLVVYLAR